MRRLLVFISLWLLLVTCKKDLLLYEKDEFKGKVVLSDSYLDLNDVPAPEATIYLANNPKADPYLFSVKADKEGVFHFDYQPDVKNDLYIVGKYTNNAGLIYTNGAQLSTLYSTKLTSVNRDRNGDFLVQLIPQYPGGILKVNVQSNSSPGEPVKGADVFLFTSDQQAATFKSSSPSGVVQTIQTNEKGNAFFHNLKTATYYVAAKIGTSFTNTQHLPVNQDITQLDKITPLSLSLIIQATPAKDNIIVIVKTSAGQLLPYMRVYLFNSRQDALTVDDLDENRNIAVKGSIADKLTDINGEASFPGLNPGSYFVGVRLRGYPSYNPVAPFIEGPKDVGSTITITIP